MNTKELLDKAKTRLGNDTATAKFLNVHPSMIGHLRHGRCPITPYMAAALSDLVGEPWLEPTFEVLAKKATTTEERTFWANALDRIRELEARAGIEPTFGDLQSPASPLCHRAA